MGCGGILRSNLDVQTIKRTASTALMKSRSIFSCYVRIVRNQDYRDHFELISKKQNRIAIANTTLQKRTIDESDNKFLKVFYSGFALLSLPCCHLLAFGVAGKQVEDGNKFLSSAQLETMATSFYQASAQSH